jgi:hypothetical protein
MNQSIENTIKKILSEYLNNGQNDGGGQNGGGDDWNGGGDDQNGGGEEGNGTF